MLLSNSALPIRITKFPQYNISAEVYRGYPLKMLASEGGPPPGQANANLKQTKNWLIS